ncbi:FixH family protein [Cupriavidus sp. CV2]|uniref:FixH family protein n=1 Tax=Cupriavidus ulmosensis TaxID=3065913 RepID=UPI00296A8F3E|nr:FixH family protein [Cupriavidus sp. CV2]MDW3687044.1 FixH family protein [Cupriavidus sp. CV2]
MTRQSNPWWKEPWPWLLMSGPLVAMVACGVTIWLAMTHPDPPIVEGVSRHGLVVEKAGSAARQAAPVAAQAR